jgi:hypothetical protein
MKNATRLLIILSVIAALASCATSALLVFDEADPQIADGPTLALEWDQNAGTAEIGSGVEFEGRSALQINQPYGNSFVVWHFSGLSAGAPVAASIDLWIDAFYNDTWVEVHLAPGLIPATSSGLELMRAAAGEDRDYVLRWDSNGEDMGTSTEGWLTVSNAQQVADEEGDFTVGLWIGHWSNNPESVDIYVDNLSVRTAP